MILKVLYLSIVLTLIFAIANSSISILPQIAVQINKPWLGQLINQLLFLGSGFGAIFSYKYLNSNIPFKFIFLIGGLGYVVYIVNVYLVILSQTHSFIIPFTIILVIISGLIVSLLYNGMNFYVGLCSNQTNKGKYYGISNMIMQSANLIGNVISSYLVKQTGQKLYFLYMIIAVTAFTTLFSFLPNVKRQKLKQQCALNSEQNKNQQITYLKILKDSSFYPLIPHFIGSGVVIAFIFGYLSLLVLLILPTDKMSRQQINSITFKLFIFEGIGQFTGGLIYSLVADKIGRYKARTCIQISMIVSITVTLIAVYTKNQVTMGVGFFLFGFTDCSFLSSCMNLISNDFKNNPKCFSIYNFCQCLSVGILQTILIFISNKQFVDNSYFLAYFILNYLLALFCFIPGVYQLFKQTNYKAFKQQE